MPERLTITIYFGVPQFSYSIGGEHLKRNTNTRRLNIIVTILLALCGCTKSTTDSQSGIEQESKEIPMGIFELGEPLRGDFIKFSGPAADSTMHIELVLDKNGKFAIRHAFSPIKQTIKTDTAELRIFQIGDKFSNKSVGRWTNKGGMLRLDFSLGSAAWFDDKNNNGIIEVLDDKVVLLDITAKSVWISGIQCKRV